MILEIKKKADLEIFKKYIYDVKPDVFLKMLKDASRDDRTKQLDLLVNGINNLTTAIIVTTNNENKYKFVKTKDMAEVLYGYYIYLSQKGEGLKILSPEQMLTRLPVSLAHLQAGNSSQKLKNEIRQLLYSL